MFNQSGGCTKYEVDKFFTAKKPFLLNIIFGIEII